MLFIFVKLWDASPVRTKNKKGIVGMKSQQSISIVRFLSRLVMIACLVPAANAQPSRDQLPIRPTQILGDIGVTEQNSSGGFTQRIKAPKTAPNIVLIMSDDAGFASSSVFGGSIPTPNLERLAQSGLRFNHFHTTGICSPTRAALLTGRNHHTAGMGMLVDVPSPYPGYKGRINADTATIARILRDNGYNTAMVGKDHNIPQAERSPSGPFDQWPTGRGFEYFFGFIAGDSDQFQPSMYQGTSKVLAPDRPENYLVDAELTDRAINWIHNQKASAPDKPFFLYYATGSPHAPNQAPEDWIERFRGKFDHGWDEERQRILHRQISRGIVPPGTKLGTQPTEIPAWSSLSSSQKRVYARFMEVIAAQIAYQDAQLGRLIVELERMGLRDNTFILFIQGDNGASAEGGPTGAINEMAELSTGHHIADANFLSNHLAELGGPNTYQGPQAGWSLAMNSPFPWFKQLASHLGAVRNGLIVSWPGKTEAPEAIRTQFHHVIDIAPSLLEAANIPQPKTVDGVIQKPMDGTSMLYTFTDPTATPRRTTQYFEILANRAIYHDGWWANTEPRNMPWNMPLQKATDVASYEWALYDLSTDFSQSTNLAAKHPDKLAELQQRFYEEAKRHKVYPLHDMGARDRSIRLIRATNQIRKQYEYWGPNIYIQLGSAPPLMSSSFKVSADIEVAEDASGVILAAGSHFGGWSFYLVDGEPTAFASITPLPIAYNQTRVSSGKTLSPGRHTIDFIFRSDGPGGQLSIVANGATIKTATVARRPLVQAGNGETTDTGRDTNVAVSPDYDREGVFEGTLHKVTVTLLRGLRAPLTN